MNVWSKLIALAFFDPLKKSWTAIKQLKLSCAIPKGLYKRLRQFQNQNLWMICIYYRKGGDIQPVITGSSLKGEKFLTACSRESKEEVGVIAPARWIKKFTLANDKVAFYYIKASNCRPLNTDECASSGVDSRSKIALAIIGTNDEVKCLINGVKRFKDSSDCPGGLCMLKVDDVIKYSMYRDLATLGEVTRINIEKRWWIFTGDQVDQYETSALEEMSGLL